MTVTDDAPTCIATTPTPRVPTNHPLATRPGIEALGYLLEADRHWRPLTTRCRDTLAGAYRAALKAALAAGDIDTPLPLPTVTDAHPATMRALTRRGLVADGRMTALAVEVTRWSLWAERGRREVTDATVTGKQL